MCACGSCEQSCNAYTTRGGNSQKPQHPRLAPFHDCYCLCVYVISCVSSCCTFTQSHDKRCHFPISGAPTASLPMKLVVEGSPLSLKHEALGLDLSGPEPLLSFGEVFVHGGKTFRIIKVLALTTRSRREMRRWLSRYFCRVLRFECYFYTSVQR